MSVVPQPSSICIEPGIVGGVPELGDDGFIRQNGRQVAALGLFAFEPGPDFQRFGNSGIVVGGEPEPIVDNPDVGIVQAHVELSNVDSLQEMTQLIMVQRSFEEAASLMETSEDSMKQLIRALNSG